MIGIGIIGAGLMGRQHAAATRDLPGARLVAVAAADSGQARACARDYGVRACDSAVELIEDPQVDAVTIATPTDTHGDLAVAAMHAGKHVFVEKPMARTLEDADRILDVARETGMVVAVGHVIRYFPEYRRIAEAIASGELGHVAVATFGRRCQQPDWSLDGWHLERGRSGGVVLDMMIHDVDLVRWYFGEPTRVFARTLGPDRHNGLDYALATLHVPDGPICHLHASWAEPEGFSQSAEVCGSAGMLSYDSRHTDELLLATHGAAAAAATALPPPPTGPDDPFRRQLLDFLGEIRGEATLQSDGAWAMASLRVALALIESSDRREPVEVGVAAGGAARAGGVAT